MAIKTPRPYQVELQERLLAQFQADIAERHRARFAEYLASCGGNPYKALYLLATILEKPGRIPQNFSTLLDLDQADALSRAFVAGYARILRGLMPARILERIYKFDTLL